MIPDEKLVAIEYVQPRYPDAAPFHPGEAYPEYQGPVGGENGVYAGVRALFRDLGLDAGNFGTPAWNPLADVIKPGMKVLVKPSIVLDRNASGAAHDAVVTHGSLVRAVTDYALKALQGTGTLVIGDAPVQQCDFARANEKSGVQAVADWYRDQGTPVALLDFRFVTSAGEKSGVRNAAQGDPAGFVFADLAHESMHRAGRFAPTHYDAEWLDRLRVTNYDPAFMKEHHNADKHEYIIARTALEADVVISLPKLKTHRKVGLTVCLKNLIGINGHKDCLPHHAQGSTDEGGDEYLRRSFLKRLHTRVQEFEDLQGSRLARYAIKVPKRLLYKLARRFALDPYFEGSWWGNDTLWRTVLDINRILRFWKLDQGGLATERQRVLLSVVDGVVAGEKEGPLAPTPKGAGILLAGLNATAADIACATVVGFDWKKLPLLREASARLMGFPAAEITVVSNGAKAEAAALPRVKLAPPQGWQGHVELAPDSR